MLAIDNYATGRRDNLTKHAKLTLIEGTIANAEVIDRLFFGFRARGRHSYRGVLQGPGGLGHRRAGQRGRHGQHRQGLQDASAFAGSSISRRLSAMARSRCSPPIPLDHPINPVNSSYAISKTAGENYVQFSGVDWVTFRLANVIGPRNVSGPLPIFYRTAVARDRKCFVTPARRDFCFAGDLAEVVVQAGRRRRPRHLSFLVGQGRCDQGALRRRGAGDEAQRLSRARN